MMKYHQPSVPPTMVGSLPREDTVDGKSWQGDDNVSTDAPPSPPAEGYPRQNVGEYQYASPGVGQESFDSSNNNLSSQSVYNADKQHLSSSPMYDQSPNNYYSLSPQPNHDMMHYHHLYYSYAPAPVIHAPSANGMIYPTGSHHLGGGVPYYGQHHQQGYSPQAGMQVGGQETGQLSNSAHMYEQTSLSSSFSSTESSSRRQKLNKGIRKQQQNQNRRSGEHPTNHRNGSWVGARSATGSMTKGGWGYNKYNNYQMLNDRSLTLHQLKGDILNIAKDRDGSKFIQRRIQLADHDEIKIAYDEAIVGMEDLWDDVYGNYILQGMLDYGTESMRYGIGKRIVEGDVVMLSTKIYGCRVIQKAMDTLSKEKVANIISSMKGKVGLLVHDHNGNHVIQKSVTKINELLRASTPPQDQSRGQDEESKQGEEEVLTAENEMLLQSLDIIIDEVADNIKALAVHPYGCRVVQRLIENCTGAPQCKVLDSIASQEEGPELFVNLMNHEYGNYVVQRILAYGRPSDRNTIFDVITGNIIELSKQKHSSNVVEMMLTYGSSVQRQQIIDEILDGYSTDRNYAENHAPIALAQDSYANYVMKTVLDLLEEGPKRERMFGMLMTNLEELEKTPYSKQIVLRVRTYHEAKLAE